MKKIISFLLSSAILASMTVPALAETDKMRELLLSVKQRIGITDEYDVFNSSVREDDMVGTCYRFDWSTSAEDNRKEMNVTVTANGTITDYYFYSYDDSDYSDKPNLNQMTVSEAAEKTKAMVDALNPSLSDKIVLLSDNTTQSLYSNGFSFELARYENGIPVMGNEGYVRVNKDASKIRSYYISYDEKLVFPSADGIMTEEAAQKTYDEKIGMKLVYTADFDYDKKIRNIIPVYIPSDSDKYINAVTGEVEEFEYYYGRSGGGSALRDMNSFSMKEAASDSGFSDAEIAELSNISDLKSKEELINIVKSNKYIGIDEGMKLTSYRTSKAVFEENYFAYMSFEKQDDENYNYVNANVNMRTGEIVAFSKNSNRFYYSASKASKASKKTDAELTERAEEAARELAGEKFAEYKASEDSESPRYYYIRYINGIPYGSDIINVELDQETGEVINYSISYSNAEFPSVDGVISAFVASEKLFETVDYSVVYSKMSSTDDNARLIYILDENIPHKIDAFTGKLLGYSNEEYKSEIFEGYTDISGHYAEDKINELARFGVRFDGNECKPDEPILQKDYVALLVSVFVNRDPIILKAESSFAPEYRIAKNSGIVMPEEENPTEKITRALAAKYMIRAMKIDEYASIPNIYVSPFKDVTEYVGQIAILNGLGIVKGDGNGNFNPSGVLTRADAMILIYNYLKK